MMGRQNEPDRLFYEFSFESHLPAQHLLRRIDALLDLSFLRTELASFYSSTGRPSVDPELMIRMLLIGYCYGIRSERRLCEEVHLNLAYRWFCRLGLEGGVPDHSTFSKNRHGRFRDAGVFRRVFEAVVHSCMQAGLVGSEGFAIDASVIEADASHARRTETGTPPSDWSDPSSVTRPVREYLAALDAGTTPPVEPDAEPQPPKTLSLTDPTAAWTNKGTRKVTFGYGANFLIDTKRAIIVDVEATPARWSQEVGSTRTMIRRTAERLGLHPQRLTGDTAYSSGGLLAWLMGRQIEPHVPVLDRRHQTKGMLTREAFTFDRDRNAFICSEGKVLSYTGHTRPNGVMMYHASPKDCAPCLVREQCTSGPARTLTRNVHEDAREHVRALRGTEAYERSARERRKIEMLFAHLKRNLGLRRLRLRGLTGAGDEFLLAATALNLGRLARTMVIHQGSGRSCLA